MINQQLAFYLLFHPLMEYLYKNKSVKVNEFTLSLFSTQVRRQMRIWKSIPAFIDAGLDSKEFDIQVGYNETRHEVALMLSPMMGMLKDGELGIEISDVPLYLPQTAVRPIHLRITN